MRILQVHFLFAILLLSNSAIIQLPQGTSQVNSEILTTPIATTNAESSTSTSISTNTETIQVQPSPIDFSTQSWPNITIGKGRSINFSGYQWAVRTSAKRSSPGLNYFNNSIDNLFVDENGYLHMKIIQRNGLWISSGLYPKFTLGYGSFSFTVEEGYDKIDPRAVVGLFTYMNDTNQIDIQLSQWGNNKSKNSQYVLQPHDQTGNQNRFNMVNVSGPVVHSFTWTPEYVLFQTFRSRSYDQVKDVIGLEGSGNPLLLNEWKYTGARIPVNKPTKVCLNFWLYHREVDGYYNLREPLSGKKQEIVIRQFRYKEYTSPLSPQN